MPGLNQEESMETDQQGEAPTPAHHGGIPNYEPIDVPPAPEVASCFDSGGPRLMITHIVNENFKSYAGMQTLGPFHKSFSAIVGPNGSGKSNVIDSMLFVFGYRANKIRSKKISVLIHNSEDHQHLNNCTVAVHFQKIIDTGEGEMDYDVVPDSQLVVSRTAFKDNSSYYKVNDKKATYKEVAVLLRATGIDLDHNRFLILQGEVEQIAMMKPKGQTETDEGMLEFLEDIIGSHRYKEPISILNGRVETLNELRGEKLNRVKVVEKEKDDLEGVKNEAIEYLTIENDIARKNNISLQKFIYDTSKLLEVNQAALEDSNKQLKEVDEKLAKLAEEKKTKSKEMKKVNKHLEEVNGKVEESKECFSKLEQRDVRCLEDQKHNKAKLKKLAKSLQQEKQKLSELQAIPQKTEGDVEELKTKLAKLEKEKEKEEAKLAEVMEGLKTETQGLQVEKESKEKDLIGLQKNVNDARSKMTMAQSEMDLYMSNLNSEKSKLRDSEKNLEKAKTTLKERRNAVADIEKKLPEAEMGLKKAETDLARASQEETELSEKVRSSQGKVVEARNALNASAKRGKILAALLEEKRSGRIKGIYGRLGDLGAIDDKYDVAISTCCGPLDNIVVDTIATAEKCVNYLKVKELGKRTFAAIEKMQKWKEHCRQKKQFPEGVPRLFDLIKVKDEDVLPVFYQYLGDTLVADDLTQARRIAYGATRYRVVTLRGDVIELSGTMSGGGRTESRGRMGSCVVAGMDQGQVERMEAELKQDTTRAQTCRENKARLEQAVERLTRTVNEMKYALEKFSMDIQSLSEQEVALQAQIKEQQEKVKQAAPDEATLQEMEKGVEDYRKAHAKAAEAAEQVEEEVHALHKQIMDIGGNKLKAAEGRVQLAQTQIDQTTGHITKAGVAIKTAIRNAKKCEDKVANVEEEQKETQTLYEELEKETKEIEELATKAMKDIDDMQATQKEVQEAVGELSTVIQQLEKEEQEIQTGAIDARNQQDVLKSRLKENKDNMHRHKKQLGKVSLHEIEGQEVAELAEVPTEELEHVDQKAIAREVAMLEGRTQAMKPNMAAINEYKKKEEQYLRRVGELDQITEMRDAQRSNLERLRRQRLDEFMSGFSVITNKLKEMYQMITLGGDAELELVDSLDPFSEGIVFSVRPPKKSWKNISNLSGGEKTLSSLALVFALHHYRPTPLYVMDEIDAALDFKNVSIVANYIKERTKNAQFIIISLRNNMFELADRLIGIYKTYNCTKSVTINPNKINQVPTPGTPPTLESQPSTSSA